MTCHAVTFFAFLIKMFSLEPDTWEIGHLFILITPCPSAPVTFPVDKFAEIVSPVRNYASLANKWITFLPGHKETLSPVIFWKTGGFHWNRVFSAWS